MNWLIIIIYNYISHKSFGKSLKQKNFSTTLSLMSEELYILRIISYFQLSNFIKNQREHHKTVSFKEEFEAIVKEAGLDFDPQSWDE